VEQPGAAAAAAEDTAEIARWRHVAAASGAAVACWEVFLRLDSTVLTTATKVWLFPLLFALLTSGGAALGGASGHVAVAALGSAAAGRVRRLGFPWVAAAIVGVEYALLAYHHGGGRVDARVLGMVAAVTVVWSMARGRVSHAARTAPPLRTARATAASDPRLDRAAAITAALTLATFAFALTRPDVGTALIKRNSVVGRVLGHGLTRFAAALPTAAAPDGPPSLPAPAPLGRTNVVLLSIDTLRRDALTPYGAAPERSPRLAALASRAVVFADAYAQVPSSAPSMATVFTGLYAHHHRVRANRTVFETDSRLPAILAAAGYTTAGFVTNPNFAESFQFDRGFQTYRYEHAALGRDGLVRDTNDVPIVEDALTWVRMQRGNPFFVWVHLMAPHSPYLPPNDLVPARPTRFSWFNVWNMQQPEARLEDQRTSFNREVYAAHYAAEVASADRLVGYFLDGLAGVDAHVIVLADHGETFGESDVFGHGRSLDEVETRVPLIWRLPHAERAATVSTTVQLADVMPTLLRLLDIAAPAHLDGRDVGGVLLGTSDGDDGFAFTEARFLHSMGVRGLMYAGRTRARSVWIDAGYPYTCAFDRSRDPDERVRRRARSSDPLFARVAALASAAQAALTSPPPGAALDAEQKTRLRALGYAE
jgi:arylsulfatase A-like enzyme